MKHLPAIDGLRAIAVLAVVAYHAGLPVPAGFVGVDVFFVISGYLITRLLAEEQAQTGRIDFAAFYARRARRILPALAVVILATMGLASLLLPDPSEVAKSAAAATAFVANVFFQTRTGGYWSADATTMPLLHLWSLSVEEQFYLVWPLVLLLARRKPVAALATLAVVSLALCEWWLWQAPTTAFYQMPARAWELALGGLVALRPIAVPKGSAWAGLALVLVACFVPFAHFPGIGALPAVAGAALLIAGIHNGEAPRPLTFRPVAFVGLISYSLYLWHWPLLALERANRVGDTPLPVRLALVAMAFVLAAASYRYVEQPARRAKTPHRRAVGMGVACLVVMGCGAIAYANTAAPVMDAASIAANDYPKNRPLCHQQWDSPVAFPEQCQSRPGTPDVVLWGDSMALAWQPLVMDRPQVGVAYSRDDCAPLLGWGSGLCAEFNRQALARARQADTVILVSAWRERFTPAKAAEAERQLDATLAALPAGVVILGPTPMLPDVPKCLRLHEPCVVKRADFLADTALARAALRRQAAKHHARYVDPTDFFCRPDCTPTRDGYALYWDRRHVTSTAAREFEQAVAW